MSNEEFCDVKMTEKEEWEAHFNGKRCSIEALDSIIIKKRGNGPEKPIYTHTSTDPGPYYDPRGNHIHIWKSKKNIKNLNGEQNQNVKFIQFTDDKPGYYCSICHVRNKNSSIKWVHSLEKPFDIPEITKKCVMYDKGSFVNNYLSFPPTIEIKEKSSASPPRCVRNWNKLMYKVLHVSKFDKVEYRISNSKVLFLWPWELTPYQKFKMKYPNHKNNNIFINNSNVFKENYAYII
jgi:hypothetical protein